MQLADKNDVATLLEETEREEVIANERLKAAPSSVRCVFCQNDNDKQQMHKG